MHSWFLPAEKHYPLAVAGYSRAISLDPGNAIYYANRAAAHIRVENYGLALSDASKSIELDPRYVKVRCYMSHLWHMHKGLSALKKQLLIQNMAQEL